MNYQRRVATRGKRGAEGGARVCKHVKMESGIVCFGLRSELGDGVLCILLGLFLVLDGFLGMANIARILSK